MSYFNINASSSSAVDAGPELRAASIRDQRVRPADRL